MGGSLWVVLIGKRGPKPKPRLEVVRDGNPAKRPLPKDVELPPGAFDEPKWADLLPDPVDVSERAEMRRARRVASERWNRWYPILKVAGRLAAVDEDALTDAAVTSAMIVYRTRQWAKNPDAKPVWPSLTQLRSDMRAYRTRFYLTPGDRAGVDLGGGDDHDADFDRPADPASGDSRT